MSYKSLEAAYTVSKKDTLYLYNAALVATEAKSYDVALDFYEELIRLGYTGISINYYATEKESGKEQVFQDMKSRDFSVDVLTTHISPRDEMAESVEINILRSIAAIYRSKENFDKSLEFLERAKAMKHMEEYIWKKGTNTHLRYKLEEALAKRYCKKGVLVYSDMHKDCKKCRPK